MTGKVKLTDADRERLCDMRWAVPGAGQFIPDKDRRDAFRRLVERGLAVSAGFNHGGEGFCITEAGRAALEGGE